jgi:predicted dehydrogenase
VTVSARVRVGLVGCGRIARVHLAYLRSLAEVELAGVSDSSAEAREAFARETGLPAYATVAELIEACRPGVVHVLTPPRTHAALAIEVLGAGVNVLIEKPMALTRAEADRVIDAARARGCWVSVDHNRWFDPVVQEAAALLRSGRLGRLTGVEIFQGAEAGEADKKAGENGHWTASLPGGVLHNLASHPLYLMRRFAGPAKNLKVVGRRTGGRLEEVQLVADGEHAPAAVTMSLHTRPFMNRLSLRGTEASLEVNLNNMTLVVRRPRALPKLAGKVWPNLSEAAQLLGATFRNGLSFLLGRQRFYPGIGAHLGALYASVVSGGAPPVSADEGRDVVAYYEEILAQCGIEGVE